MARLIGLLLLVGLAWLIVKRLLGPSRPRSRPSQRFEKTVRCARCGVHMPLSLAHIEQGDHVCRDPHCTANRKHRDRERS